MKAWEQFLAQQEAELGIETVHKWLKPLRVLRYDAGNLFLEAKDSFQAIWFEEHIRLKVQSSLVNNNKKRIKVHLTVANIESKKVSRRPKKNPPTATPSPPAFTLTFDLLDPHCSLENVVLNDCNILPHKLMYKILHNPTELATFNPVYIHGSSGTGKTHFLMGAAQALMSKGLNVIYTRAETFTEHVVSAIRAGEMSTFRHAYRNSDVLIIDDVHVFSRKNATQEELFHTFNTLHMAGKQIILSANCSPAELQMIEPRLVSRFEWGIVLPLEPLKKEEIQSVLAHKMSSLNFTMQPKVAEYLLETFPSGTKALIKALQALVLRCHLKEDERKITSSQLTIPDVRHLLEDLIQEEEHAAITATKIIQYVSEHFGMRPEDIQGKAQTRDCVLARQLAMYLCRCHNKMPYLKIGELFSKDHSTVMSSVKAIQRALDQNDRDVILPHKAILKKMQR